MIFSHFIKFKKLLISAVMDWEVISILSNGRGLLRRLGNLSAIYQKLQNLFISMRKIRKTRGKREEDIMKQTKIRTFANHIKINRNLLEKPD